MSTVTTAPTDRTIRRPQRALRIGMIAPPWFAIPPVGYGGTETVVANLVDQLADLGHEVTLVAAGPAGTRATRHISTYATPPSEQLGATPMPEVIHAAEAIVDLRETGVDARFEPLQRMYHPGGLNADDTEQRGDDREDLEPLHPYSVHAIRVSLCADFVPKDERVTNGQPAT